MSNLKRANRPLSSNPWNQICLSAAVLCIALAATTASAAETVDRLGFELRDQFGALHSSEKIEADLLILIGGDRESRKSSRQWARVVGDMLDHRIDGDEIVAIVRLADLRRVPEVLQPVVAGRLRKSYTTPILMDWRGELAGTYAFQPGMANIAVFDSAGNLLVQLHGNEPNVQQIDQVEEVLGSQGAKRIERVDVGFPGPLGPSL